MPLHRARPAPRAARTTSPRFQDFPLAEGRTFSFYDFTSAGSSGALDWHYHEELELICWPTASGVRVVGDSISQFHRGDLCLIGSNTPHAFAVNSRGARRERNLQVLFPPGCLGREFLGLPEMRRLNGLFERARRGLVFRGETRRRAAEQLLAIAEEKPAPPQRFLRILSLLTELADSPEMVSLAASPASLAVNPRIDRVINRVLQFVRGHLESGLSQLQVAALLGMSPPAFSRFFRRHVGKTFVGFVNEIRIGKACMLLLETDQTIAEVAYACGFQNLSHFNQQFRRYKHICPREHRDRLRAAFANPPKGR